MNPLTGRDALMVLNAVPQLGPIVVNRLLEAAAGNPGEALEMGMAERGGLREGAREALREWRRRFDPEREKEGMEAAGARFLTRMDHEYPRLLNEIGDPPPGLYCRGRVPVGRPCLGIIGTRRCTAYGEAVAREFGRDLARAGVCVVSGMALGIDSAAHRGALEGGGGTVAVLGSGVDVIYPWANRELAEEIVASGALLSEFPMRRRPDRIGFIRRNRVISGMCPAVVVVESDVDGGAMITAGFAGEQGRTVCAVPGRIDQPTSAGCHKLLRDGATLVTGVAEIVSELGVPVTLELPLGAAGEAPGVRAPDEAAVLKSLEGGALMSADALGERTGLGADRLAPALMLLELNRLVGRRPDGRYERLTRA
ncbi:MAG: DNA-processing protein DprA [Opitutaceae bacterium]